MPTFVYGDQPETILRKSAKSSAGRVNHVLMGSILEVTDTDGDWLEVDSLGKGPGGWVHEDDVRDMPISKPSLLMSDRATAQSLNHLKASCWLMEDQTPIFSNS